MSVFNGVQNGSTSHCLEHDHQRNEWEKRPRFTDEPVEFKEDAVEGSRLQENGRNLWNIPQLIKEIRTITTHVTGWTWKY